MASAGTIVGALSEYHLYARRYAPFKSFGGGFEGDDRLYSTDLSKSSRTVGMVTLGPKPSTAISGKGYSDGSAWVGPWEVRKKIPLGKIGTATGTVKMTISDARLGKGWVSFTMYTEGNLPLKDLVFHKKIATVIDKANQKIRSGSRDPQGTPDIDTFVDIKVTYATRRITFEGVVRGDAFPNAELFVMDCRANVFGLLDFRTWSSEMGPLYRLMGSGRKNVFAKFSRIVEIDDRGFFTGDYKKHPPLTQEKWYNVVF